MSFIQAVSSLPVTISQELIIQKNDTVQIQVPKKPLGNHSLQVKTIEKKDFHKWTDIDNKNTFEILQKIASIWGKNAIAEQYLIYGKQKLNKENKSFRWEIVPFSRTNNIFSRIWHQFTVLIKITFPGNSLSKKKMKKNRKNYEMLFNENTTIQKIPQEKKQRLKSNDPFCQFSTIDKQLVFAGEKVNVLYNYAPIGFGGERLHFLIIPKNHKTFFTELTLEEYLEAMNLAKKMSLYFLKNRSIQDVYLFHKTGKDAGQTVPHWHMHLILTTSKTQDFFGKLTVFKKMLLGGSPLKKKELKDRVEKFRKELFPLSLKSNAFHQIFCSFFFTKRGNY